MLDHYEGIVLYSIYSISSSIQLIRPPIFYRDHNFLNNSFILPPYVTCNVIVMFWKDPALFVLQGEMCNPVKKNETVISAILSAWILLCFALLKKIIVEAIYDCWWAHWKIPIHIYIVQETTVS